MRREIFILALVVAALFSCGGKEAGEVEATIPDAPTGLVLHSSSDHSLTFQWESAGADVSYKWTLTGGDDSKEGTTRTRNVMVEHLQPATVYNFSVASVRTLSDGSVSVSAATSITARTAESETPVTPPSGSYNGPDVTISGYSDFRIPAAEDTDGKALAFPGAEGGGMFTTGGRGGAVYHVTNLKDNGEGSLRWAVNKEGARTIVFDVAGVIELESPITINKKYGDVTIAGQTAPGSGICLKNYTFRINANNVIIRYIRCRMGDSRKTEDDAMNLYTDSNDLHNVIIDHCSLSWSTDECGSFYGMTDFTLQWCILSESLLNSIHKSGKHGYGGIWGGTNATYHHNLLAHHYSRNPRLDHDYVSTLKGPVSLVNNVFYNWGDNSTYGGESANDNGEYKKYNIVNNYYKPGPATTSGKIRFIDPWTKACNNCAKKMGTSTIVPGHFYLSGNVMDGKDELTKDNWKGTTASDEVVSKIKASSPFVYSETAAKMTLHDASGAFSAVLDYAGASLSRDKVDTRIAKETREGTYTYKGSNGGTNGFIDTQEDAGGWPSYTATEEQLSWTADGDGDGMPDWFETKAGLDPSDKSDGNSKTLDAKGRYTNLEMYLHFLVRDIVAAQAEGGKYGELK